MESVTVNRYCTIFVLFGIFACVAAPAHATTRTASDCSYAAVSNALSASANGDTVIIPAGQCSWTSPLVITKAITLQGSGCTLDANSRPTSCSTIIQDDIPDNGVGTEAPVIDVTLVANSITHITGIQFNHNAPRNPYRTGGAVRVSGSNVDGRRVRIDTCFFNNLYSMSLLTNTVLGVIDHNTFQSPQVAIYVYDDNWNGRTYGDGAWTDANNFGTDRFLFIEDNSITCTTANCNNNLGHYTMVDGFAGMRYVFRYNVVTKGSLEGHGTESGQRRRGMRAVEVYRNTFAGVNAGQTVTYYRGGVGLIHDNCAQGYQQANDPLKLVNFREFSAFPPFSANNVAPGGADGTNPWDVNASGGPFYSGAASSGAALTVTVSGAAWATNQWRGYSIKKTSDGRFSEIQSNTSNTITYLNDGATGQGPSFTTGDAFTISKVVHAMDQPGRSGGSLVTGDVPVTRPVTWNDQVTDPWYEWNNLRDGSTNCSGGADVGFGPETLNIRINEHFFNNAQPGGYTPYTYPHPLVSGAPSAPASPTNLRVVSQ